jgi:Zn-dependent M28 family amino/carboxypeptidase
MDAVQLTIFSDVRRYLMLTKNMSVRLVLVSVLVITLFVAVPLAGAGNETASSVPSVSAGPKACENRNNNTHKKLLECVTVEGVRAHQAALQAIANANGGTRVSGSPGYDASVDYVVDQLNSYGYNVTTQVFDFLYFEELSPAELEQTAPGSITYVNGTDFFIMEYSGSGNVTAPVQAVDLVLPPGPADNTSNSGCEAADFAGFTPGNIALMQRGTCSFFDKAANAQTAGAVGAIIFNEGQPGRTGLLFGTLGGGGVTIPVVGTTFALGNDLANTVGLEMRIKTDTFIEPRTTANVLAETTSGDPNNVVMAGAHLDSVAEGPGIQDNGSGSAALLEVAKQMAKVKPRNMVRFAWWGAEEAGLVGSEYYVFNLTDEEFFAISLYLNFDMVGSPNHVFFIYDGDNSDGVGAGVGPAGSAEIEKTFERYYDSVGESYKGTDFDGRSDYLWFITFGIPAGGLFTGAEGVKTPAEAAIWGGTAGVAYDPCYHQACDTFDNVSLHALDVNSDAIAYAVLQYAMNTEEINGVKGKGNFKPGPDPE